MAAPSNQELQLDVKCAMVLCSCARRQYLRGNIPDDIDTQCCPKKDGNNGGGKMKVMSSNKTVCLLQEDLLK